MLRHMYVRIALAAVFIVLSASVVFSPAGKPGGGSTAATVTPGTDAKPQVTRLDDRSVGHAQRRPGRGHPVLPPALDDPNHGTVGLPRLWALAWGGSGDFAGSTMPA